MKHLGTCVIPSAPQNVANGRRWLLGRLEPLLGPKHSACEDSVLLLSETLTNASAPRSALSYPRFSREKLEGGFWA